MAERLTSEAARALRAAGWFPGRRTDDEAKVAIDHVRGTIGRHGAHSSLPAPPPRH